MVLYLLDKNYGRNGLNLLSERRADVIVLVNDGVYLDVEDAPRSAKIYAVKEDVERRGMKNRLGGRVELIDYDGLVDLIIKNKVANFA